MILVNRLVKTNVLASKISLLTNAYSNYQGGNDSLGGDIGCTIFKNKCCCEVANDIE